MHDIKWIRENPEAFDEGLKKRGLEPQSTALIALDKTRREALTRAETLQQQRKKLSKQIGASRARGEDLTRAIEEGAYDLEELKREQRQAEVAARHHTASLEEILRSVPNLPDPRVPIGADEAANIEVSIWGKKPELGFDALEHFEIGEALGAMDFERAAKLSGSRFVLLTGPLARLERALAQFMLDLQTNEFGYNEVSPPVLVRDSALYGTGQLPKFGDDLFKSETIDTAAAAKMAADSANQLRLSSGEDLTEKEYEAIFESFYEEDARREVFKNTLWLIPTAEVPLTNLVADEILDQDALPLRFTAHTGCFRAEAGAAGKDTRGMLRQHQFYKVELVSIVHPDESQAEHERMTGAAEAVLQRLGLHYRKMVLSTGDMGFSARKTYDLEVWLPGQDAYREISSCSNCGDFQARRMNARFRPSEGKGTRFVHTLNGSGLAVGRALIAVLENYQREDGTVTVPEVLRSYMGGIEVIGGSDA
jgi:seryl-tRNA synthetase